MVFFLRASLVLGEVITWGGRERQRTRTGTNHGAARGWTEAAELRGGRSRSAAPGPAERCLTTPDTEIRTERDLWESCWVFITPSLPTCLRDGEGARASGSRPDRECHPGGKTVEWEKEDTWLRLRLHPLNQPAEVRSRLLSFSVSFSLFRENPGWVGGDSWGSFHAAK